MVDGTPSATTGPTTTVPLPERADCTTVTGPGPGVVVDVTDGSVPCLAVAGHHRVELTNPGPTPIELSTLKAS